MSKTILATACTAFAAFSTFAAEEVSPAEENTTGKSELSGLVTNVTDRLSFHAFADVESAYICRGYIWDVRPYSAQYADTAIDLGLLGQVEASIWTMSAMSGSGNSARMSRYAYAEADYLLRYYYDVDLAEGWRLRNFLGRQWVTNPGYCGGRTLCDWQALQVLNTPWLTPYWRLRVIRQPIDETFWCVGVKRGFQIMDNLTFTVDFSGDLGDNRHYVNLYGPKVGGGNYHGGLKDLMLVARLDYTIIDHVGILAFVGQFCLVSDDARDAIKNTHIPEARRDLTFGGVGVAVEF